MSISIAIVEDLDVVRNGLKDFISLSTDFLVVDAFKTGEEAFEHLPEIRPDIVIMDINLPGMNGIEATQQIRKYSPGSKILGVSLHTQPTYARKMIQKGAMGYVTKNSSREEMFKAIMEVQNGRKYICDEIKNILSEQVISGEDQQSGLNSLSQREIEIIAFIKKGHSSKEIADSLNISVKTVEVHRYNILKKLNLKNAAALVNFINNSQLDFED